MTDQYKLDYIDAMRSRMLLQCMVDPAELSATPVWLASEAGPIISGQTIVVSSAVTQRELWMFSRSCRLSRPSRTG